MNRPPLLEVINIQIDYIAWRPKNCGHDLVGMAFSSANLPGGNSLIRVLLSLQRIVMTTVIKRRANFDIRATFPFIFYHSIFLIFNSDNVNNCEYQELAQHVFPRRRLECAASIVFVGVL